MIATDYYRLPGVSMRAALFQPMARNELLFREADVMFNWLHPSALGHRYLGDLVIAFLQNMWGEVLLGTHPLGGSNVGHRTKLPPPLFQGVCALARAGGRCARRRANCASRPPALPACADNYEYSGGVCWRDDKLRDAAVQPVEVRGPPCRALLGVPKGATCVRQRRAWRRCVCRGGLGWTRARRTTAPPSGGGSAGSLRL